MKNLKYLMFSTTISVSSFFVFDLPSQLSGLATIEKSSASAAPRPIAPTSTQPLAQPEVSPWALDLISHPSLLTPALTNNLKSSVLVAIIDTGCDSLHPALRRSLWTNPGESGKDKRGRDKATNGVDDDHNSFVDDVHGWNFAGKNDDISDHHTHGTHIAGIIHQVAPQAKLMILKYYDPDQRHYDALSASVQAMKYAIQMNALIINYSGGGQMPSPTEEAILKLARQKNVLVVAASGNESSNTDRHPFFPASYKLDNILTVAAIDKHKQLVSTSNYGPESIHIAAPGRDILSSFPQGERGIMSGTSQATAFVTGVAASLMANSADPSQLKPYEIISQITATAKEEPALHKKLKNPGIVNESRALNMKSIERTLFDGRHSSADHFDYDF